MRPTGARVNFRVFAVLFPRHPCQAEYRDRNDRESAPERRTHAIDRGGNDARGSARAVEQSLQNGREGPWFKCLPFTVQGLQGSKGPSRPFLRSRAPSSSRPRPSLSTYVILVISGYSLGRCYIRLRHRAGHREVTWLPAVLATMPSSIPKPVARRRWLSHWRARLAAVESTSDRGWPAA